MPEVWHEPLPESATRYEPHYRYACGELSIKGGNPYGSSCEHVAGLRDALRSIATGMMSRNDMREVASEALGASDE